MQCNIVAKLKQYLGFYPGTKTLWQNLPCKLTFGEEAHKSFTYLYIMIHNPRTLATIAPQYFAVKFALGNVLMT